MGSKGFILFCASIFVFNFLGFLVLYAVLTRVPEVVIKEQEVLIDNMAEIEKNVLNLHESLSIVFSHDISQVVDADKVFKLVPHLKGEWKWRDEKRISFAPEDGWPPGFQGVFQIVAIQKIKDHLSLKPQVVSFSVQKFLLESVFQKDVKSSTYHAVTVGLEFNAKVDPQLLIQHLVVKNEVKENFRYEMLSKVPSSHIEILLETRKEGLFQFEVDKDLRPLIGSSLGEAFEKAIKINFSLNIHYMKARGDYYDEKKYVDVRSNKSENVENLKKNIRITPSLPFRLELEWHGFEIHGNFQAATIYTIAVDKNLSGFDEQYNQVEVFTVQFPNEPQKLSFPDNSIIYGLQGKQEISIESTNVDIVTASLCQIPRYNYNHFLSSSRYNRSLFKEDLGRIEKKLPIILNQKTTGSISMAEFKINITPGFYEINLKIDEKNSFGNSYAVWQTFSKKVIITNLGVSCRKSTKGLMFWVNQLSDLAPVAFGEIKLFARSNKLLYASRTDERGIAEINVDKDLLDKVAFVLIENSQDVTYLKFDENLRDQISEGSLYSHTHYIGFLNLERNVFRPGEILEVDGVVRDKFMATPEAFPVILEMASSDGKILHTKTETLDRFGSFHVSTVLSEMMSSGTYHLKIRLPDNTIIGRESFDIASFMPQRLSGSVKTLSPSPVVASNVELEVFCEYLTGASAEGLTVYSEMHISEISEMKLPEIPDYKIGLSGRELYKENINLSDQLIGKDGKASINYQMGTLSNTNASYRIDYKAKILDRGNREFRLGDSVIYYPKNEFVAIKSLDVSDAHRIISVKVVDSSGKVILKDQEFHWVLYDLKPHWTLVNKNNYYTYEYSEEKIELEKGVFSIKDGVARLQLPLYHSDKMELLISNDEDLASNLMLSNVAIVKPKNPYDIVFKDVPSIIKPGDEINISASLPFKGKALICLEDSEIRQYQVVEFVETNASFSLKIPESSVGSLHLSCTLLQSQAELGEIKNYRASGVRQLVLDHSQRQLRVEPVLPAKISSSDNVKVSVFVKNFEGKPQGNVRVLLSFMDKGIQDVKGKYKPDLFAYFYGPHSGIIGEYDYYQNVFAEKIELVENLLPGGGGDEDFSIVKKEKFISFKDRIKITRWQSPAIVTNELGEVVFELPKLDYQGLLNFQIWCVSADGLGYFSKDVLAHDDIVVEESFPKFVYTGDQFVAPLVLQNFEDEPLKVTLQVIGDSLITINPNAKSEYLIEAKGSMDVPVICQVNQSTGSAKILMNWVVKENSFQKQLILPVISQKAVSTIVTEGVINEVGKEIVSRSELFDEGEVVANLQVSSSPIEQLRGSLEYLITYPYGCSEQTISKLLPLVYSKPILALSEKFHDQREIDYYLLEGIRKLQLNQNYKGGINVWTNDRSANLFVSAYAGFLFAQLNKIGFDYNKNCLNEVLSFLQNELHRTHDGDIKTKCFVIYVLALHGYAPRNELNKLLLQMPKLDRSSSCFLYMSGLLLGVEMPEWEVFSKNGSYYQEKESGGFFASYARDLALELMMATDFPLKIDKDLLLFKLLKLRNTNGHWGTSQENAWCYLALMKYLQTVKNLEKPNWSCNIFANDQVMVFESAKGGKLNGIQSKVISVEKMGEGALYYQLSEKGFLFAEASASVSSGIQVVKEFLALDAKELSNKVEFEVGTSYLVKISITCEEAIENVVVQEFFAAGFEFIFFNEDVLPDDSYKDKSLSKLPLLSHDIRDDRMYLFAGKLEAQTRYEFYYIVRSTVPGKFHVPKCKAEAMYNPALFGQSKSEQFISKISKK